MKKITMIMLVLIATASFAQNGPINFEPGGFGADWTWTVFENDTNPALEIIANPDPSGINTSATVAKFTALASGEAHAGVESQEGNLGSFVWDDNNRIVKIMVWKSVISNVGIKFDGGAAPNNWSSGEILVANTVTNQWEELTFDFSNAENPPTSVGGLKRIIIFPDFASREQENIVYFDNITFSASNGGTKPDEPATAAPTPTQNAANVKSLFSSAYTDVPVDTWRTPWSEANYEEVTIAGHPTKKYTNLNYVGIETIANQLDVTGMTHFHLSVWSPNYTQLRVKLVDFGADGGYGGGDDTEHELVFNDLPQGEWVSLDMALADFTNLASKKNIAQLIFAAQPVGTTTIFVDNVFFYNESPTSINEHALELDQILAYPNPVKSGGLVHISADVKQIDVFDFSGRIVMSLNGPVIQTDGLHAGIYLLKIQTNGGSTQTQKLVVN